MRRLLILAVSTVIAACIVFCACGETSSKDAENGAMVEVKDDNGSLTGYERRFYNDNGDVTRLDVFDQDQTCLYYELYEYDENNRLSTQTRYSSEGFGQYRYAYSYDDDGKLIEKAYEDPHGGALVYRYDSDGEESERLYYDTNNQLTKREVLEKGEWVAYDADGKEIK